MTSLLALPPTGGLVTETSTPRFLLIRMRRQLESGVTVMSNITPPPYVLASPDMPGIYQMITLEGKPGWL